MPDFAIVPSSPSPLGVTRLDGRVNFALFSEHATAVDLCLFDPEDASRELARVRLPERTREVFHVALEGVRPGQPYAYRVHGPYQPEHGHRFNPSKLLLDPYARAIEAPASWSPRMRGAKPHPHPASSSSARCLEDSASEVPRCLVVDDDFDWEGDHSPGISLSESIVYEAHVKGFTKLHPDVPEALRGTYAGLVSEPALDHLRQLGITTVSLLPVQQHLDDEFPLKNGVTNYWGYNTIGYFAPEPEYAASREHGGQVAEFKEMVKRLHQAGIEVWLDVVYNHTAEGGEDGPTVCFRGIDNASYYRLPTHNKQGYKDTTGCGNVLNLDHPRVAQLVADSLRYWVEEMHVDGFRFDLAATLGREGSGFAFNRWAAFFKILGQDPTLSRVKLIAEPWDIGCLDSYQVGGFPPPWSEWNGRYRDRVRMFWKGDSDQLSLFARRITGSDDIYRGFGRPPQASINFVTCHDGFTLLDLVSYDQKHNQANGENNRDGSNNNHSWNCGIEGKTDDAAILDLRDRQRRNFMTTLLLSLGVPMICAGDEFGRTQKGNNNGYAQDNEISWLNWKLSMRDKSFLEFTQKMVAFRKNHPLFRKTGYYHGGKLGRDDVRDVVWFRPDGGPMTHDDWHRPESRAFGAVLCGLAATTDRASEGRAERDDTFILLVNAGTEPAAFVLPGGSRVKWRPALDTRNPLGFLPRARQTSGDEAFPIPARSLQLLTLAHGSETEAQQLALHPGERKMSSPDG